MNSNLTSKYRSKFLSEIIGQPIVSQFLLNSLYKKFLYPLYLFSGMHGTGKTSTARIFALSFLCEKYIKEKVLNGIPCYECDSCKAYKENRHPDIIELDAASNNGVETIRALIENVPIMPVFGGYKFYIIDEVHMLSKAAFNACLKIMEEPPEHVCFILATTEFNKVLETVRSRSVLLKFNPIKKEIISNYLLEISNKENIKIEEEFIELISEISEGSVRDSLNHLEKFRIFDENSNKEDIYKEFNSFENKIYFNFIDSVLSGDEEKYFEFKNIFFSNFLSKKVFWRNVILELQKKIFNEKNYKIKLFLKFFYENEKNILTSIDPSGIFDLCFFELNQKMDSNSEDSNSKPRKDFEIKFENEVSNFSDNKKKFLSSNLSKSDEIKEKINSDQKYFEKKSSINSFQKEKNSEIILDEKKFKVENFIKAVSEKEKPLGVIFSRAKINYENKVLKCFFPKALQFYKNFLQEKESSWKPTFLEIFGLDSSLKIFFDEREKTDSELKVKFEIKEKKIDTESSLNLGFKNLNDKNLNQKEIINEKSPIAKEIGKFFPGTLNILESKNEKKYYT